jgi:type IV secretion system protein TrbL
MSDLNIIDQFLATFVGYIDSGFGLLKGDLAHLTSLLIALDVTIAALFWALDGEDNLFGKLIKKVLYVGAFAYILNNFQSLANLIYQSFAQLGVNASSNSLSAADMLKPGKLAGIGFEAAHPLLVQITDLMGLDTILSNLLTIAILLIAWLIVMLAFFVLAIQLFITVLEFKLTTLAGFTLVPFAFWNKTAFLAERVLGNVITSGIKIMVLAVIIGIGSGFFSASVATMGTEPDIAETLSLVLASLTFLGLGIFGPSIASGLVAGAPQLGAGAALGTAGAAAAAGMLAAGGASAAIQTPGGWAGGASNALKAAASMGGGKGAGPSSPSTPPVPPPSPPSAPPPSASASPSTASAAPAPANATGGKQAAANSNTAQPEWAKKMQDEQRLRGHLHAVQTAIAAGDQPVATASPDITQKD